MRKGPTIFLIDDDIDDREIFVFIMDKVSTNLQYVYAKDGVEALEKLDEPGFIPDVIFLDINMPRMDGLTCLTEIRKISRLDHVPIYIYSTSGESDMPEKCKTMGCTGFIKKQIRTEDVIDEFKTIIANIPLTEDEKNEKEAPE